ncbi:MAG TPA: SUMF1/EgtB/PvdO family nonheme iron enzyme [Clostridiales bacterium]|nr:SUMF1/EgtB/PvdO family nonheme iron enzyme [Clostridiales bacterium]HQP68815.1 SUMF1/EgtB/PvdO family nonheme iron enzyme [Clostridiales bacterium]
MKKIKFILIFFIAALSFSAQFEIVKDVTELPGDLTAQRYGYKDVNGQWCAILKVHTDVKDLQFEGIGYEKHDYRGEGVYLVYLQPDTKNLKFKKEGSITKSHNFPFKLKPNTVYMLELKGAGELQKIEEITISILVEPENSIITLDGDEKGGIISLNTSVGRHELKITKDGYQSRTETIHVDPKNTLFKYKLDRIAEAVIVIDSEPGGAIAYIDGVQIGKTPVSSFYPEGTYRVRLSLGSYEDFEETIEIKGPETKRSYVLKNSNSDSQSDIQDLKSVSNDKTNEPGGDYILVRGFRTGEFYIGKTEVTQAQWKAVMGNDPSEFKGEDLPVETISWSDAVKYCNKLSEMEGLQKCYSGSGASIKCDFKANGYRLPTGAEWEYAAKGGSRSMGYKFSGSDSIEEVGWFNLNSGIKSKPVATKKPNEIGIYDMSGNVWEWCWDWDIEGATRVIRGGSWLVDAIQSRFTSRDSSTMRYKSSHIGFRVVRLP